MCKFSNQFDILKSAELTNCLIVLGNYANLISNEGLARVVQYHVFMISI